MPIIHELSSHLADLIAAGEVVERPASVAKELIENSIDAGADRITVEIENGGISYLRIADNGIGMEREDAVTAFRRHATSKLRKEEDLSAIMTLGFRGEALAAISSVSRIDLFTKQKDTLAGLHLHLEAGNITDNEDAGCPEGTTIIVRDLFFNTPARMKFLKKDFTEAGYILSIVQHAALSHPEIAFSFIKEGKQIFSSAGNGDLKNPIFSVFGREITESMIGVPLYEKDGLRVTGFITKPHMARPNRSMQHFFVNGRCIKSKLMQAALEESYKNAIITGKYPSTALFLDIPYHLVDVNVHPAKTEVKFAQERAVFEAIYIACKNALQSADNMPQIKSHVVPSVREDHITKEQQAISLSDKPQPIERFLYELPKHDDKVSDRSKANGNTPIRVCSHTTAEAPILCEDNWKQSQDTVKSNLSYIVQEIKSSPVSLPVSQEAAPNAEENAPSEAASVRVIGECFHTYLVAEDKDGLVLIDKHAAHERIIFNVLRENSNIPQQVLLIPAIIELSPTQSTLIMDNIDTLQHGGFLVEPFGNNSFAVRAVPAYLEAADISSVLSEIAEKLGHGKSAQTDRLDDLMHTVACKAAIKAGSKSDIRELQALCDRVLGEEKIRSCPHGRPVSVRLTKYELDKLFKRVNQ